MADLIGHLMLFLQGRGFGPVRSFGAIPPRQVWAPPVHEATGGYAVRSLCPGGTLSPGIQRHKNGPEDEAKGHKAHTHKGGAGGFGQRINVVRDLLYKAG